MLQIGSFLEIAALCLLVYAVVSAVIRLSTGRREWEASAIRAVFAATAFIVVISAILLAALIRPDFRLEYVASHSSTTLPLLYQLTAFWAGQAGSLLFWLLLLMCFTSFALVRYRRRFPKVIPYFLLFTAGTGLFFNLLMLLFSDPFKLLNPVPPDGMGMNPLLQNVMMVFHPPTLFVGYVGFTIPFAFAMAALLSRSQTLDWVRITRNWVLVSWIFLTVGIILGAQWAYVELGWGGYWAWDPVENASFIPWLSATALLHTVILQQRRGMFKKWNVFLVAITFLLCVFGTFITRSGFIESVHAFARSNIGYYFLFFIALMLVISLLVINFRRRELPTTRSLEIFASKEGAFVLTNLIMMSFLMVVLAGTVFPTISEIFSGSKVSVTPAFFNKAVIPFGLVLLFLLGICPVIGWQRSAERKIRWNLILLVVLALVVAVPVFILGGGKVVASILFGFGAVVVVFIFTDYLRSVAIRRRLTGEAYLKALWNLTLKNKRRYGAYLTHLGVVSLCLGIIGSAFFSQESEFTVDLGQSFTVGEYTMTYKDLKFSSDAEKSVLQAVLQLDVNGKPDGILTPEKHLHRNFEQPMTEVSIHFNLLRDLYVIFSPISREGRAHFKVLINPLVIWIWIGGALMALGALYALVPNRRKAVLQELSKENDQ